MPRGGARPGAGRKPKNSALAKLHGSRDRGVVRFPGTTGQVGLPTPPAPSDQAAAVAIPRGLPGPAKRAWKLLAPFAAAAGTLTDGTAAAFGMLCRAVVLERQLGDSREAGGSSHRGMMQRVEAGFVRFSLAPVGKPIAQATKPADDPFAEFNEATGS